MLIKTDCAIDALNAIPPDLPREEWVRAAMGAHAAGVQFDAFDGWSAKAANYDQRHAREMWNSLKPGEGIGPGTLFKMAIANGWQRDADKPQTKVVRAVKKAVEPQRRLTSGLSPPEVWGSLEPATAQHPYIGQKGASGVPLGTLRVVPADDRLTVQGERMAGALVVPVTRTDGSISSLQFIAPPDVAARLKAKNKPNKLNLPGASMDGFFTVGELAPGGVVYVVEGIGAAWSCWQATGQAAVVCFGWGRVRSVAAQLRERDAAARLVLVPDVGKESDAAKIALEVGAAVVSIPGGWPKNSDVNDLAQREGLDVLATLLASAREPPKPEPRYKLLGADDLRALPALAWRMRGVLPAMGLAGLYGPSASGKSFLALDMAAAIAEGRRWFDCRVEAAPVVYAALEGEGGFKLRVAAWEAHTGRVLPAGLSIVLQPFKLTTPQDVADLATVVPPGAVVFLDTLNRAAPTADENSSRDMGEILEAAKRLQSLINGLVVLVHHTGKDATKGLRGHSSLFAALDAALEVSRDGERRAWKVAKAKDGQDGEAHPFTLQVEVLGTDDYGDAITSCVVMPDNAAQQVRGVKLPQGGNQRLVLDALRPMFKDAAAGKPGAPPLRPCIELEAAVTAGAGRLTCPTDRRATRAREAITGLVSRGVMGLNEGCLWLN